MALQGDEGGTGGCCARTNRALGVAFTRARTRERSLLANGPSLAEKPFLETARSRRTSRLLGRHFVAEMSRPKCGPGCRASAAASVIDDTGQTPTRASTQSEGVCSLRGKCLLVPGSCPPGYQMARTVRVAGCRESPMPGPSQARGYEHEAETPRRRRCVGW